MTNDFYSVAIGIQNKGGEIVGVVLNVQTGYSLILAGKMDARFEIPDR